MRARFATPQFSGGACSARIQIVYTFTMVLGFHVIFSAYGFWLPNDPRGSWSDWVRKWELRAVWTGHESRNARIRRRCPARPSTSQVCQAEPGLPRSSFYRSPSPVGGKGHSPSSDRSGVCHSRMFDTPTTRPYGTGTPRPSHGTDRRSSESEGNSTIESGLAASIGGLHARRWHYSFAMGTKVLEGVHILTATSSRGDRLR